MTIIVMTSQKSWDRRMEWSGRGWWRAVERVKLTCGRRVCDWHP